MTVQHLARNMVRTAAIGVVGSLVALTGLAPAPATEGQTPIGDVRNAVFVGNNWEGTVDILEPGTLDRLGRINMIPDQDERMMEIATNPERLAYYMAVREAIGEGHDQLVDDMYSSNDGTMIVASRPSYADVVAISLETGEIVWRTPVAGQRSDHMAISPDGTKVVVSASTANVVHVLSVATGEELGSFPSGGSPHENVFIDDGRKILHAAIGYVYTPTDQEQEDPAKGERVFQVVDANTYEVLRRYNLRKKFDAAGHENLSTAVRPMTLSPNEHKVFFQVSFFHGFIEMDLRNGKVLRYRHLPNLVKDTPREQYLLDSAHHGIAMNPSGTKICVAGTMSDYATVVDAKTFKRGKLIKKDGGKPYWVTQSGNGRYCYISWSGTDQIAQISYKTGKVVSERSVGDHPQRIRNGFVAEGLVAGLTQPEDLPTYEPMPPIVAP